MAKKKPPRRGGSSGWRGWELFQGEAGDGATRDVFIGDGRHVGVGYILEAADACSQDEPFGEGVHLFVETVGELRMGACGKPRRG